MAKSRRTHKGEREQLVPALANVVYTEIASQAADHSTSVSQLAADLLSIATGHPELVRDLRQTILPEPRTNSSSNGPSHNGKLRNTKVRVPRAVYDYLRQLAAAHGSDAGAVSADLLSIATGHPELARELHQRFQAQSRVRMDVKLRAVEAIHATGKLHV